MNARQRENVHHKSKGFMGAVSVTDFPIKTCMVVLKIRCRRWTDIRTGKSPSVPVNLDVAAEDTRHAKESAAFLKETNGGIPRGLPYAPQDFYHIDGHTSDALAEPFNARNKLFRANLRGVLTRAPLFRITKSYSHSLNKKY